MAKREISPFGMKSGHWIEPCPLTKGAWVWVEDRSNYSQPHGAPPQGGSGSAVAR